MTAGGWVSCSRPRAVPALPQLREMASLVTEELRANGARNLARAADLVCHRRRGIGNVQQEENAFLNWPTLNPPKAKGAAALPHPPLRSPALRCKPTACDGQWRQTGRDLHSVPLDPTNPARSRLEKQSQGVELLSTSRTW